MKRVNIQYSIDLDELPSEVDRIYSSAHKIFSEIDIPDYSSDNILSSETLKQIDDVRKKLTCLDHILNDVHSIVGSYVEYEVSKMNQPTETIQEPTENVNNTTQMST